MPRMSCPYSAMEGSSAGGSRRMSFPETPLFRSRQSQAESADTNTDHVYKNEYVYEDDKPKQVKHNTTGNTSDVIYHFTYDALGANTNVSVGNQSIITKAYSEDRSHVLESETYGNSGTITYDYDDFDRLTEVKLDNDNTKKVTYTYGNNGQIEKVENAETGITSAFRYDLAGRPMGSEEKDGNGTTVHSLRATYDECQNLESSIEKVQVKILNLKEYGLICIQAK